MNSLPTETKIAAPPARRTNVIALTGFMGTGKTTVARALARALACAQFDLDAEIELRTGRTIASIFKLEGDARFRAHETATLRALLQQADKNSAQTNPAFVIALGGGAWTLRCNRKLLQRYAALTVWLDVPFEICWQRISRNATRRPLAPDLEQTRTLYKKRRPLYALADLRLAPDEQTNPAQLAMEIINYATERG